MTDSNRRTSNVAMEQMIGNMTSGLHNPDGQYIHLGYTPPPSPSEPQLWNSQNQLTKNPYSQFNMHNTEPHTIYSLNQQMPHYNQHAVPPFNYVQPTNMYGNDPYEKSPESNNYVVFQNQNLQDLNGMYHHPDYRFFFSQDVHNSDNNYIRNHVTNSPQNIPNPTQLIDNVVGNWVPNTTGTYSPFGNTQSSSPIIGKIFDIQQENDTNFCNGMTSLYDEMPHTQENPSKKEELLNFHFTRDTKKPRMVAEVKPMRPSYSDVLTKSAPQANVKPVKLDSLKEPKQKKDNKRILKNEKSQKASNSVRLNNLDTKIDRNNVSNIKLNEKIIKTDKSNQLNRKWASLDNVNGSGSDLNEDGNRKNKKGDDSMYNKNSTSNSQQKLGRNSADFEETESGINKNDTLNITKASIKKGNKYNVKQKNTDGFGCSEKPSSGKRNQRIRKRENNIPFGVVGQKIKQYIPGWWRFIVSICMWLLNLISDICSLSVHLSRDMVCSFCKWFAIQWMAFFDTTVAILNRVRFLTWIWEKFTKKKKIEENSRSFIHSGLQHNITMPTTGEEAMKRLLACKGKDPYSILGVTPTCTDDDIKKYYKRQAFLVHPDKNQQPGAEEAFKILVHAFDMIGEPERRATYDRGVAESAQVEQAWSELTELLAQLQKKVEAAANTIRCSQCNLRHKRIKVDRPSYAARNCTTCKIHHSAREGDIWAEARCLGFLWHYYACMEGGVYDITEWAGCQKESLKHLRPDTHHVQYRIALGKQNGQARRQSSSPRSERPPDLENLLNSLYGNQDASQNARRRNKKSNK